MILAALLVLALLGAPLFVVIATSAMLGYARADIPLSAVAIEVFGIAEMPILLAIPLFTFAGYVLRFNPITVVKKFFPSLELSFRIF